MQPVHDRPAQPLLHGDALRIHRHVVAHVERAEHGEQRHQQRGDQTKAMTGISTDSDEAAIVSRQLRRSISRPTSSEPMMPPSPPPRSVAPRPVLSTPRWSRISGSRGSQLENVAPLTKNSGDREAGVPQAGPAEVGWFGGGSHGRHF